MFISQVLRNQHKDDIPRAVTEPRFVCPCPGPGSARTHAGLGVYVPQRRAGAVRAARHLRGLLQAAAPLVCR